MSVFLLILKIIGFVLLGLVGLVLLLLLMVLFVPIRYDVQGEFYDKPNASIKVTWLLHAIRLKAIYDGKDFDKYLKIFWFQVFPKKENTSKKGNSSENSSSENIDFSSDDVFISMPASEGKDESNDEQLSERNEEYFREAQMNSDFSTKLENEFHSKPRKPSKEHKQRKSKRIKKIAPKGSTKKLQS